MEQMTIFDEKFHKIISDSVKSVLLQSPDNDESSPVKAKPHLKTEVNLSCSYCHVEFSSGQQQREHYKLDWHRYNLKQSLLNKPHISEEHFVEKSGKDDLSSISGSDSDSEKEHSLDKYATAQGKILLQNETGHVFSIYRCLVCSKKEDIQDIDDIFYCLKTYCIKKPQRWTIFMVGGGHFAGAIFDGNQLTVHKTFHCYTVRAGQGGSQSSRDNKSGGSHPKSAGAALRRHNEQTLIRQVNGVVNDWLVALETSGLIFYRATGPYNRSVLFGGNPGLFKDISFKLRTIPFSTGRPTLKEVVRVHSVLSSVQVYSTLQSATEYFAKLKSPEQEMRRNKARSACINRAKSREIVERPLPGHLSSNSSSEALNDLEFTYRDVELSMADELQEFDNSVDPKRRQKPKKKKKVKKSPEKKLAEIDHARKKELLNVLFKGDLEQLKNLLENHKKTTDAAEQVDESKHDYVNEVLDENGNTLLHIAAMNEHIDLVSFLMKNNADPTVRNKANFTVYSCMQNREIRECLKQFARDYPEKYNYNKAQIPTSCRSLEEQERDKIEIRRHKREKAKEKRKENAIQKREDVEKDRFMQLSDREKMALTAERRILSQGGTVTTRCFTCGCDMAGKVPFEYAGIRFCTMVCLTAHRRR